MRRDEKKTTVRRIRNFMSNYPQLAEGSFYRRFWNKLEHDKITEWVFYAAGLLAFLVVYLLFLNFIIWARLSAGWFP